MNKNIILAGVVVLVIGLAIAIGVTLSGEPVAAALPEGEVVVNGDSINPYSEGPDDSIGLPAPSFSGPGADSEIITVKNVDEVLKVALTKPFKRVEWVEVDQISNKGKSKQ